MDKKTQMLIGVVAVGAVAYYLWKTRYAKPLRF